MPKKKSSKYQDLETDITPPLPTEDQPNGNEERRMYQLTGNPAIKTPLTKKEALSHGFGWAD